jgi:hypothetical protein
MRERQTSMNVMPAGGLAEYFTKKNSEDQVQVVPNIWPLYEGLTVAEERYLERIEHGDKFFGTYNTPQSMTIHASEKLVADYSPSHVGAKSLHYSSFLKDRARDSPKGFGTPQKIPKPINQIEPPILEQILIKEKCPSMDHQNIIDGVCSICNIKINGLIVRCPICLHGGHRKHIQKWF